MKRSKHGLFVFPSKENPNMEKACSIGQSCCSMCCFCFVCVFSFKVIQNSLYKYGNSRLKTLKTVPCSAVHIRLGEEPLWTMSYQTSSKRSPPFCLLIGARKLLCFSVQSKGRTAATVWNWSGMTLAVFTLGC